MATIFKFKNKLYQCMSLDKKLKKLKIPREDIEIIFEGDINKDELESKYISILNGTKSTEENNEVRLYYFKNRNDNSTITSIYSTLDNLKGLINITEYANEKNRLWNMCQVSIKMLNELMNQIEKADLKNEQFVLDWLDKLNELSVKW